MSDYIDVETGEIITKSEYTRKYYATGKKTKKYEENEKYRIIKYGIECRPRNQTTLF